ncbi:hypothetical protein AGABI2DRAFT_74213 [Agaricus bisporus var. bisporus H97]|uniref:hypothetical protein n=1 Tax=Agaricus bisporus var. bisporus (strain H97 / ATCC MYA-4626 / FGSC 10389) TaxID=936046 RepID=UPI00029F627E|nr:hypothetical protein AGABI2DRAFT_74213 [Agaricus bisporus var. bisporus H97]EKV45174.1 hypothetical protein AGABI2DRAFT_74213 [Agaricus bisporus var. bisporus H97]
MGKHLLYLPTDRVSDAVVDSAAYCLQGPYMWSLYRVQYGLPERLVALLFVTGFVSEGVASPLVGAWADQYGRRKLCLAFCVISTFTCILTFLPNLPTLILGRLCGGISAAILYTAFEPWLVSSASSMGQSSEDLSTIISHATLVNGFVASGAGIISNKLVATTIDFTSPLVVSGFLLVLGFFVILKTWSENYGDGGRSTTTVLSQTGRLRQAWRLVCEDPALLTVGLTQTCFEGSMYFFAFIWVPSLQEVSRLNDLLPLGYIFASFMVSITTGSILYNTIVARSKIKGIYSSLTFHAKFSSVICAVSALTFAICVASSYEDWRYLAFLVFEICVGMYFPVQGMLRGMLISKDYQATVVSLFRLPLSMFVVISLMAGVSPTRQTVLSACAVLLGLSSLMTGVFLVYRPTNVDRDHPTKMPQSQTLGYTHTSTRYQTIIR